MFGTVDMNKVVLRGTIYGDYIDESKPTAKNIREDLQLLARQAGDVFETVKLDGPVHVMWFVVKPEQTEGK